METTLFVGCGPYLCQHLVPLHHSLKILGKTTWKKSSYPSASYQRLLRTFTLKQRMGVLNQQSPDFGTIEVRNYEIDSFPPPKSCCLWAQRAYPKRYASPDMKHKLLPGHTRPDQRTNFTRIQIIYSETQHKLPVNPTENKHLVGGFNPFEKY